MKKVNPAGFLILLKCTNLMHKRLEFSVRAVEDVMETQNNEEKKLVSLKYLERPAIKSQP